MTNEELMAEALRIAQQLNDRDRVVIESVLALWRESRLDAINARLDRVKIQSNLDALRRRYHRMVTACYPITQEDLP